MNMQQFLGTASEGKIYVDMDCDGLRPDIVQIPGGGPEVMRILKASAEMRQKSHRCGFADGTGRTAAFVRKKIQFF